MDQEPQEVTIVNESSEDYPMGGSLEPYDIWRDLQMLENARHRLGQIK
ncbi:MAG: hypothetical protein U9M94_02725 [Patescibacteria group bacterium]|nr:hypothetical protein [Patescibacteria group bacterium]